MSKIHLCLIISLILCFVMAGCVKEKDISRAKHRKGRGKKGRLVIHKPPRKIRDGLSMDAQRKAYKWLDGSQNPVDGGWDAYKNKRASKMAVTSFVLIAFLESGYSRDYGPYKNTVLCAQNWVINQQNPNGAFGDNLFEHGLAIWALAEVLQLANKEAQYKKTIDDAVAYAIKQLPAIKSRSENTNPIDDIVLLIGLDKLSSASRNYRDLDEKIRDVTAIVYERALKYIKSLSSKKRYLKKLAIWSAASYMRMLIEPDSKLEDYSGIGKYLIKYNPKTWGSVARGKRFSDDELQALFFGTEAAAIIRHIVWKIWNKGMLSYIGARESPNGGWYARKKTVWGFAGATAICLTCFQHYYCYEISYPNDEHDRLFQPEP